MNTRDTFGQAIKATFARVKGIPVEIFKTPKTDSGMKKSAKGLLAVYKDADGEFYMKEQATWEEMHNCEYKMLFKDSELMFDDTLANIRERLAKG